MATNYTSLLGFALPTTGELAGTWGQVVNDSITQLVEDSVAGTASVSVTAGDVTLTTTGSGAANQARCAVIIATGTPGTARNIIAPSQSKAYIVINQSDSNVTFKGAATTGHVLKPGDANLLAWNGSDFMDIEQGDVAGPASATDNAVVRFDGTTGKLIQNSAVTIADTTGDIETSGKISVGDGTASLPSITNTGDTNTGIYFSADNEVSITTNGTKALTVASNQVTTLAQPLPAGSGGTGLTAVGANGNVLTSNGTTWTSSAPAAQVYPGAGIAVSTGSAWTTSKTSPSGNIVGTTDTQTLTNKTIEAGTFTNGYTEETVSANTGTGYTIDLANGTVQILTLTGNCTFTFPTATAGRSFIMLLKQDATGGRTVTWPAAVKWPGSTAPTITSTASKLDKYVFTADGTNWYGSNAGQNYTV